MKLQQLVKLLNAAVEKFDRDIYTDAPECAKSVRAAEIMVKKLRDASNQLTKGNLTLPWIDGETGFKVDQPITDLLEVGTPIEPESGNDLTLNVPIKV